MKTVYLETNGLLYIQRVNETDLEEDRFHKLWYHSKLSDSQKFDPKLAYKITEKLVNKQRLKLEYPGTKETISKFSLW